jgi:hypothetical protein
MLTIADVADSFRIDFSRLDTPTCAIGMRRDTVNSPDMVLIHTWKYPVLFLLRTPHTPGLDSLSINTDRFSESSMPSTVDSLRKKFLPIAASVNPECRLSGRCDTTGGGFFVRTSENGVAFWKPIGLYVGGIDRYSLFWAYSSDGSFGTSTETVRKSESFKINTATTLRKTGYVFYDPQGRLISQDANGGPDKSLRHHRPIIMINPGTERVTMLPFVK